nr:DUF6232 family protein [Streptomyces sp. SID14515]
MAEAPQYPPLPRRGGILEISVKRRILWVGSAAFPLHNLTRVDAYEVKPDRVKAVGRFLKWLAGAAVVFVVLSLESGEGAGFDDGGKSVFIFVVIGLALFLLKELFEPAKPILAVDTAGGTGAVVTLPSVDELRVIAGQIVYAIDHPEAEFTAYVQELNNYNGPVFNQHGGQNTGIKL